MSDYALSTDVAAYLPELTRLVNAHLALTPPGWGLNEAQVAGILLNGGRLWEHVYGPDEHEPETRPVAVTRGGRLVAAAQWLRMPGRTAVLDWLFADGAENALRLVNAVVAETRGDGYETLWTKRHGFGIGWFGTPVVWPHVVDAFVEAGFEATDRWRIMTIDTTAAALPDVEPPDGFRLTWKTHPYETMGTLWHGAEMAGEVQMWALPKRFAPCPGAAVWTTIEWLGVEPPYQRRGLGRLLLTAALRHARRQAKPRVAVWVQSANAAALALHRSLGFVDGPECLEFEKTLDA